MSLAWPPPGQRQECTSILLVSRSGGAEGPVHNWHYSYFSHAPHALALTPTSVCVRRRGESLYFFLAAGSLSCYVSKMVHFNPTFHLVCFTGVRKVHGQQAWYFVCLFMCLSARSSIWKCYSFTKWWQKFLSSNCGKGVSSIMGNLSKCFCFSQEWEML